MKLDIVDIDKLIEVNSLQEISSPILFDRGGYPTEDGLFSYTVFGRPGSNDRKTTFAYIDLGTHFFHPLVYKTLIRLKRKVFINCITEAKNFIINKAGFLEENENGESGIGFLYKNWGKFKITESSSNSTLERVAFIENLSKKEVFINKQIIIPPHYRDVNLMGKSEGKLAHDLINDYYAKLIRMTSILKSNSDFNFMGSHTMVNIQETLVTIFEYFTGKIKGKNGLIHQAVMGKSVDYAGRSVISAANFNYDSYEDGLVSFQRSGLPITQLLNLFYPFIIKWLQDFFAKEFGMVNVYRVKDKKGNIKEVELDKKVLDDFNHEILKKKVNLFVKSPSERFETVKFKTEEGYKEMFFYGTGSKKIKSDEGEISYIADSSIYTRPLTWTDLFYQACVDVCKDKHVYLTRYPLEDYFGIYATEISVLSTFDNKPQIINGKYYPNYPVIDVNIPKDSISSLFIDTLQIFGGHLEGIGGDFDGDQLTVRGVFTDEANQEAHEKIYAVKNILNITGRNIRSVQKEGIQTLYNMTID